ncbi:uncharacterized protein LOC143190054 isoform X1 [Rhynchophorus ferrugineus]|uniref:uncharacterized protein LOC143190054 isoform X1 n=1 Tax=Rhynchophorus ferrugineus TaxID=354439 RepID=UPI003FCCD2D7
MLTEQYIRFIFFTWKRCYEHGYTNCMDPHSKESELCWRQLLYKIKPLSQVTSESAMEETTLQTRNAELSNLLMEMFKSDKTNGKRNPDLSANVLKYMTDWSQYKGN